MPAPYVLQVDGKDKSPSDVTRALVIKYLELMTTKDSVEVPCERSAE